MLPIRLFTIPSLMLVGCVQLSVEVEDVCLHKSGLAIAGLPLPDGFSLENVLPAEMPTVEQEFVQEDFEALDPILNSGLEAQVFFTGATFRASGVDDLSFVRSIELVGSASDPNAALGSMDLGSCPEGACTNGQEAHLTVTEELDIMQYIDTGSLTFRMTVGGDLPREDWALDVDLCMRGSFDYQAGL